jgi:hypothetical protein
MAVRVFLGALAGAIIAMIWGILFWGILPFTRSHVLPLPNEEIVVRTLRENIPASGAYVFPMPVESPGADVQAVWTAKHKTGPLLHLFYHREGNDPMNAAVFIKGFIHYFISALLLAALLLMAGKSLPAYPSRVAFIALAGIFAAVFVNLSDPIWWWHVWGFHLLYGVYTAVCWLLVGLVMAWIIRPATSASA